MNVLIAVMLLLVQVDVILITLWSYIACEFLIGVS